MTLHVTRFHYNMTQINRAVVTFLVLTAASMKMAIIVLMMDAASTSETSVNFYPTTRCNNREDSHLQQSC
jgi:hypothetical protein